MTRSSSTGGARPILLPVLGLFLVSLLALPAYSERFHYDAVGRLVRVIYDDLSSITYEYDANGNLLSVTTTAAGPAGDTDLDGDVDDDDVAAVLALILADGQPYSPTADCNGDDRISVADLVCTINAEGGP
jgi:YD repeat-containing protein